MRQLSTPGRYADGNGLYLVIDPSGARRWLLRTIIHGKRCDLGLGGTSLVSLAEAREIAQKWRKLAREGGDPREEKRKAALITPTFQEAAEKVHAEHKGSWKNEKHAQQWINTLATYAFPDLGSKRIDQIATPDILRVLAPIWLIKPETARRVRQRIGTVMDWAKASGYRVGDNPVEGVSRGLPKQTDVDQHHAALPYQQVPAFVHRLRSATTEGEVARLALEFLILTAGRTSEILNAPWSEVDIASRVWTIPAERMKAKRAHRVPLSDRTLDIISRVRVLNDADSQYLFPSRTGGKALSNMVFLTMMKRMGVAVTAHGFRSSFRDWVAETTAYPRELAEMALAHTIANKVEAAYQRGDLLEKRALMMQSWAEFLGESFDEQ